MPGDPLTTFHPALLHVSHLVYKLIVESPIVLGAEEIGNNDHVVMFQSSRAFVLACHQYAHIGANKRTARIERFPRQRHWSVT